MSRYFNDGFDAMGGDSLEHGFGERAHKYIDRIRTKSGKWRYIYKQAKKAKNAADAAEAAANAQRKVTEMGEIARGQEELDRFLSNKEAELYRQRFVKKQKARLKKAKNAEINKKYKKMVAANKHAVKVAEAADASARNKQIAADRRNAAKNMGKAGLVKNMKAASGTATTTKKKKKK